MTGTLLLFYDYDTQWGGDRSRAGLGPKDFSAEFACSDRILELLAEHGVRATFAVVGSAALPGERPYHDPAQIRRIHELGHEVGSHAHRHEWLPGLSRRELLATLRESKDALEQVTGAPVTAFVPPYNQPFDHARGLSISLSERREARGARTDLAALCEALAETGYLFCRVAYRPIPQRLAEALRGRRLDAPAPLEAIRGVTCARLNTPGGFEAASLGVVEAAARDGGVAVAYSHPHSLHAGNSQDERCLAPFLARVAALRREGRLADVLPRELVRAAPDVTARRAASG